jgi:hypothetical protein
MALETLIQNFVQAAEAQPQDAVSSIVVHKHLLIATYRTMSNVRCSTW